MAEAEDRVGCGLLLVFCAIGALNTSFVGLLSPWVVFALCFIAIVLIVVGILVARPDADIVKVEEEKPGIQNGYWVLSPAGWAWYPFPVAPETPAAHSDEWCGDEDDGC